MLDSLYGTNVRWRMYKCKQCHVWTHALNDAENRVAILLNNRIKDTNSKGHYANIRSLNAKSQTESGQSLNVRVPILQKIKLSLPF